MMTPTPQRTDIDKGSYALVVFEGGKAVYQYDDPVDWQDPEWVKKGEFDHDGVPLLNIEQAKLEREQNGNGAEWVTTYASHLSSVEAGASGKGNSQEGDEQSGYWVLLAGDIRIPESGIHNQQRQNMVEIVVALDELYDLLDQIELPYTPGFANKNCSINKTDKHPDGREMRGAEQLPSGDYLYTGLNKQEKKDRIIDLGHKVGMDVEFHGKWTD